MTRTEKYRQYRKEIANMKFESFSEKNETSKKIENIHGNFSSNKLNYEEVMIVQESIADKSVNFKRKKFFSLTKYEIFYFLIVLGVVIILSVLLVLTGIKLWR